MVIVNLGAKLLKIRLLILLFFELVKYIHPLTSNNSMVHQSIYRLNGQTEKNVSINHRSQKILTPN